MAAGEAKRKITRAEAALPVIPDKLYFRIGEVARLLDVETYVLRFWESEFPQLKPNKGGTGQRLYRRRDVETAFEIRRLLYAEGYTIPGARQFLKVDGRRPEPVPVPQPAPSRKGDDSSPTATRLRKLKSDLREIASLLDRPSPGRKMPNPAHRGLAVTPRRRPSAPENPPPLFASPGEPAAD